MVTVMPYERIVHYQHGALRGVLEQGRHRFWTRGHAFVRVDLRTQVFDVRPQEIPTSDGITVKVSASARLRVVDPVAFHEFSADPHGLVYDAAKVWLRDVVHLHTLEQVVAGITVEQTPDAIQSTGWSVGLEVSDFGLRDAIIPGEIRRATEDLVTTRQRAQVDLEKARGEVAVLRALANSATILEDHPVLATLRLAETAGQHGGTVIIERPSA